MNLVSFLVLCWLFAWFGRTKKNRLSYDKPTLLIAHRGLTSRHVENSLKALTESFSVNADGVEFDVQLGSDVVPMVFHDRSLVRLTGISANIDDVTYSELSNIQFQCVGYEDVYSISSLEDILAVMPKQKLINIELKETVAIKGRVGVKSIIKIITEFKDQLNIVISSFDPKILSMVYEENRKLFFGALS